MKRFLTLCLTLALLCGLTVAAGPAQGKTPAPTVAGSKKTVSYMISYLTGKTAGPSANTDFGQYTITGFIPPCCGRSYTTKSTVLFKPPTLTTLHGYAQVVGPDGTMHPLDWWNPGSWNWENILGHIWNDFIKRCAAGALSGYVGAVATNAATKFLARGAQLARGSGTWQGYAVATFAGCVVGLLG